MVEIAVAWIVGIVLTLLIGHFVCAVFLKWLRRRLGPDHRGIMPLW